MNQISPWLYIGDANDGKNLAAIDAAGITAVWNATRETDGFPPEAKARIAYWKLDQDDGAPIAVEKLDLFAAWLAIQGIHARHVLVHCGAGVSRAATFATLALMLTSGMGWEDCLAHVRAARPIVNPHELLKESVLIWWGLRDAICHHYPPGYLVAGGR